MTRIIDSKSNRHGSAKASVKLAVSALLLLGTFAATASAADHRDHWRRDDHRDWHRGGPPPVVFGGPVYAAPPVVYGPSVGISIGIR